MKLKLFGKSTEDRAIEDLKNAIELNQKNEDWLETLPNKARQLQKDFENKARTAAADDKSMAELMGIQGAKIAAESAGQTMRVFREKINRENKERLIKVLPRAIESALAKIQEKKSAFEKAHSEAVSVLGMQFDSPVAVCFEKALSRGRSFINNLEGKSNQSGVGFSHEIEFCLGTSN